MAAAGVGVVFELMAGNNWSHFDKAFTGAGPAATDAQTLAALRNTAQRQQTLGLLAFGVSVAAAGTGAVIYAMNAPKHAGTVITQAKLTAGPGGVGVTGTLW